MPAAPVMVLKTCDGRAGVTRDVRPDTIAHGLGRAAEHLLSVNGRRFPIRQLNPPAAAITAPSDRRIEIGKLSRYFQWKPPIQPGLSWLGTVSASAIIFGTWEEASGKIWPTAAREHLETAFRLSPKDPVTRNWLVEYDVGAFAAGEYADVIRNVTQAVRLGNLS